MDARLQVARRLQEIFETPDVKAALSDAGVLEQFRLALSALTVEDFTVCFVAGEGPARTEHSGVDGLVAGFADWIAAFERFRVESTGAPIMGAAAVVAPGIQTGTLAGGAEVTADAFAVIFFDRGKISRIEFHASRGEAMRVAGVPLRDG